MRFLIFVLLGYVAYRIVKALFKPSREIQRGPDSEVIDEMVQDPSCKTYIPRREAVKRVIDGEAYFFCSEACASRFESEKRA